MDGEETTVASNETTTDDAASVSETTTEEVSQEPDDSKAEESDAISSDRPEWLPSNFKSPEDLAKSYSELQSKLGDHKTTEQKAQLLDRLLENPGLLPQLNMQSQNQPAQLQAQRDEYGRRIVNEDELRNFTFQDTRDLLFEDMKVLLKPVEPVVQGWQKQQSDAQVAAEVDRIYKQYPDLKENTALEERMAANIARGVPVEQAYNSAKESLTKELEELRKSIKKETDDAKLKSGDVGSSGSVSDGRRAKTIQEAAEIARSKLGK